jgi:hypothetical protein
MVRVFSSLCFVIILCFSQFGIAQTQSVTAEQVEAFKKYRNTQEYGLSLAQAAALQNKKIFGSCPDKQPVIKFLIPHILQAPVFESGKLHPVEGLWISHVTIEACNNKRQYNFLVLPQDNKLKTVPMLPGNSKTSPQLQHDALVSAASMVVAATEGKKCPLSSLFVSNTEFLGKEEENLSDWEEKWTANFCGEEVVLRAKFFANEEKGGTNFAFENWKEK